MAKKTSKKAMGKKQSGTRISRSHMNRTGIAASPVDSEQMQEGARASAPTTMHDGEAMAEVRRFYMKEAEPVGTVPPPTSIKGAAKALGQALRGQRATFFLDKVAERLAFERTGTRLYEGLLLKHDTFGSFPGGPTREELVHLHDEELAHFAMLRDSLEELGGDPTAMTPSADVVAVEAMGVGQIIGDPRTSLADSLHAILVAELADNDGWDMLVDLAAALNQDELAERFRRAKAEEDRHLFLVRRWLSEHAMQASGAARPRGRGEARL